MAKLRTFNAGKQTGLSKRSDQNAAPDEMRKVGTPEVTLPPTKAPVRVPKVGSRSAKPGSSAVEKRRVIGRGETLSTPHLIGKWSTR